VSCPQNVQAASGVPHFSYLIGAGGTLPLGEEARAHEADHSCPSIASIKNEWSYTTAPPPHALVSWCAQEQLYIYGLVILSYKYIYIYIYIYIIFHNYWW